MLHSFALRVSTIWALLGGTVLTTVVLINVVSVIGAASIGEPIPGDLELTEIGVGIAVFSFLPYCQIIGANVSADIFTSRATPYWLSKFAVAASVVALVWAMLLFWRMWAGMLDQRVFNYTSTILQIPLWLAFVPVIVSLALLALSSVATLLEACKGEV